MRAYGRAVTLMGPAGAGQLTKMVNQICIAGLVQGLAEALNFAQRAGLEPDLVLATISKGAAQSWQMENRWKTMAAGKFDFGFAVDWMRKDLAICMDGGAAQRGGTAGDRGDRPALPHGPAAGRWPVGHIEPDPEPAHPGALRSRTLEACRRFPICNHVRGMPSRVALTATMRCGGLAPG